MNLYVFFKGILILLSFVLINGCAAGLGEDFSCSKVGGVSGCASMADIRSNMDAYISHENGKNTVPSTVNSTIPTFLDLPRRNRNGEPSRSTDDVTKVTIFPFIDEDGNFVDTTDIYFILEESEWIGRLPREIIKD